MTANTGRTTSPWVEFHVDDTGGTLREIAVDSINGVGLTQDEVELTAFMDAIKGSLPAHAGCTITITGPYDTTATTGSHTVLSALSNLNGAVTPLALDVRIGIRHAWESGEPTFGITGTTTNGFWLSDYQADVNAGKYSAKFAVYSGSAAPDWATTAHT